MGASASIDSAVLSPESVTEMFNGDTLAPLLTALRHRNTPQNKIRAIKIKFKKLKMLNYTRARSVRAKSLYNFIRLVTTESETASEPVGLKRTSADEETGEEKVEEPGDETPPCTALQGGPFGVSLQFLVHFVDKHNIPDDMTTGDVVRNIIIPETQGSQLTYLEDKLSSQSLNDYYIDLNNEDMPNPPEGTSSLGNFYCRFFLSHPWNMPFVKLIASVRNSLRARFKQTIPYFGCAEDAKMTDDIEEVYGQCSFFWIDVFCKNQHKPSPAMEEFVNAMQTPGEVIVALWPSHNPISLTRIWCCYEIWTAIQLKAKMTLSDIDEGIHKTVVASVFDGLAPKDIPKNQNRLKCLDDGVLTAHVQKALTVDVAKAGATYSADIETILGMINSSIGVELMNKQILEGISDSICEKDYLDLYNPYPPCFDGDGLVSMACSSDDEEIMVPDSATVSRVQNLSFKRVKDVQVGDIVCTHNDRRAQVTLVTKETVKAPSLCLIQGVLLTPEHPVFMDGAWVRPRTICSPERVDSVRVVYNLELDVGEAVLINGLPCASLTQDVVIAGEEGLVVPESIHYGSGWRSNPMRRKYVSTTA